jgi:hypothetical protein
MKAGALELISLKFVGEVSKNWLEIPVFSDIFSHN